MTVLSHGDAFRMQVRVYYEDTDAGGVVYYANYLRFFERARTEWLRRLGVNQSELAAQEYRLFVVKAVEIQYRKPALPDDLLTVHTGVARLGGASLAFDQSVQRGDQLLCDGTVTVCSVDARTFRPLPLSPELRTLFEKARN